MSKKIIILMVMAMSLVGTAIVAYRIYHKRYFSCTAQYYTSYQNTHLKAIFRLVFNGTEGIAMLTGEVKDKMDRHLALNRQMIFHFTENQSRYLMQSVKEIRENYDEVNNELLNQLLNAFFYQENRSIQYRIDSQPNGDYVIANGKMPLAYCHHS